MKLKAITGITLTLFLIGTLTLAFNIQPVKADPTPSKINVTKKCFLNSKLFTQQDVLETIVNQINETRFTLSLIHISEPTRPY